MAEEESKEVEATEEDAAGDESKEEKKKRPDLKKPLIMFGVILVQVALAYSVAQFVIIPRLPGYEAASDSTELVVEEEIAPPKERGSIIMMDDIIVNLRDEDGNRFLKISTGLEFTDKKLEQEISERMPELRDLLIGHLANHQVEDIVHRKGREVVKRQVLEDFNSTLQAGDLINIYFSDFVVQ